MNRRDFVKMSVAGCFIGIHGCEEEGLMENPYRNISLPEFSGKNLHVLLDELLEAYESKGMHVSDSLLAPLSQSELIDRCSWFPGELPPEIISLYSWRGGQLKDAWESEFPFWFRDNSFCSVERAQFEYKSMMDSYGIYPEDHELLKYSFPFASFNGGWYVFPTQGQPFSATLKAPIVGVLQGIDIYYFSIETMVQTCIDWVSHDKYDADSSMPDKIEREIWQKHNPGIFGLET